MPEQKVVYLYYVQFLLLNFYMLIRELIYRNPQKIGPPWNNLFSSEFQLMHLMASNSVNSIRTKGVSANQRSEI